MTPDSLYPSACYNPFALSERQNFPPLDEIFSLTSASQKVHDDSVSDGLPQQTHFDIHDSEADNDIFSPAQRSALEQEEDALASANAAWWQAVLSECGDNTEHEHEPPPTRQASGAQAPWDSQLSYTAKVKNARCVAESATGGNPHGEGPNTMATKQPEATWNSRLVHLLPLVHLNQSDTAYLEHNRPGDFSQRLKVDYAGGVVKCTMPGSGANTAAGCEQQNTPVQQGPRGSVGRVPQADCAVIHHACFKQTESVKTPSLHKHPHGLESTSQPSALLESRPTTDTRLLVPQTVQGMADYIEHVPDPRHLNSLIHS